MQGYPWQTKLVKHVFGEEFIIEEVRTPWDLYLEGRILQNSVRNPEHIQLVRDNQERIFSIRNANRDPLADIITMPVGADRKDSYWPAIRRLRTSCPMTVDDQQLIVLDVIDKLDLVADTQYVNLAKEFFLANGGQLNNEHATPLIHTSKKKVKEWKESKTGRFNLAVGPRKIDKEEALADDIESAHLLLTYCSPFYEVHFDIDTPWVTEVIEFMLKNKQTWPKNNWIFYGDGKKGKEWVAKVNKARAS